MSRFLQTSAVLALTVGLSVPGGAQAQADAAGGAVPFCATDGQAREFPCRGANRAVVSSDQELMSIGGGVPPEWMQAQEQSQSGAGPVGAKPDAATAAAQAEAEAQARAEKRKERKERQAEKARQAEEERRAAEERARQEQQAAEAQRQREQTQAAEEQERQRAQEQQQDAERRSQQQQDNDRARTEAQRKQDRKKAAEERRAAEEQEARRAERRAERRAKRAASAAAAQQGTAGEPEQVDEGVVSESNIRSSSQEFDTQITQGDQIAPPARADDGGLSGVEKALLFGLGAVAVSKFLDKDDKVVASSGDRLVVQNDGELSVVKDDDSLLARPGDQVRTERFSDGSTRTTLTRPGGERVVTIRAGDGTVLRRTRIMPDGREYLLFDDTREFAAVDTSRLPAARPATAPRSASAEDADLRRALEAELYGDIDRRFSLEQVRAIAPLRELAPQIEVDQITFATGSSAIPPDQARQLADLGRTLQRELRERPDTVLLVEGHTDAVGDASYNLALSDRRAESVALALTEYFDVPPENMVVQGYGERYLKVPVSTAEPANRRAVVRNITSLLR